jgi:lycopene cyclase domain-containing protein
MIRFSSHWTYLTIDLLTIAFPFAYSFTARSGFSKRFARVFAAIALVAVPMLVCDAIFTAQGVWGFNRDYILGLAPFGLPVEEILFFLCIPFACLFIYDTVKKFPRLALPEKPVRVVFGALAIAFALIAVLNVQKAYTLFACLGALPFLIALAEGHLKHRVGHIATTYLFHLIPFFLVNGILTALPVVWYNDAENLGIRLGTIPVEDTAYSMMLLFGAIFVLEWKGGKLTADSKRKHSVS